MENTHTKSDPGTAGPTAYPSLQHTGSPNHSVLPPPPELSRVPAVPKLTQFFTYFLEVRGRLIQLRLFYLYFRTLIFIWLEQKRVLFTSAPVYAISSF